MEILKYSMLFVGITAFVGCGGKHSTVSKAVPVSSEIDETGSNMSTTCTKSNCPDASMGISASGLAGEIGLLVGFVGEDVEWKFEGIDQKSNGRSVSIFLQDTPSGSNTNIAGGISDSVTLSWVPASAGPGSKPVVVVTRDMDRCRLMAGSSSECEKANFMSDFDVQTEMGYEIVDRAELEAAAAANQQQVQQQAQDCASSQSANQAIAVGAAVAPLIVPEAGSIIGILGPLMGTFGGNDGC